MKKHVTLLRIAVLAVASLILVGSAFAQSTVKPSVPEFTLKVVADPYDVEPTYSTDPLTGKSIMTKSGRHKENRSIEVMIKNQPFTPYPTENGNISRLFYEISYKGHYEDTWRNPGFSGKGVANATDTDYTIAQINLELRGLEPPRSEDGQLDVRVRTQIGYYYGIARQDWSSFPITNYNYLFVGETGSWSNTQTITIPALQTQTSPTDITPTPPPNMGPTASPAKNRF